MAGLKNSDREVFNVLLVHWINHTGDHMKDYREWSEKIDEMMPEVSYEIKEAIDAMMKSSEKLMQAKIAFQKNEMK